MLQSSSDSFTQITPSLKPTVLWISDYGSSGYGNVARCLVQKLLQDYSVHFLIINSKNPLSNAKQLQQDLHLAESCIHFSANVVNTPQSTATPIDLKTVFGCTLLPKLLRLLQPNIVFTLNDMPIVLMQKKAMDLAPEWDGVSIAYVPIDGEHYPFRFFQQLQCFDHIITMNKRSRQVIREAGFYRYVHVLEHPLRTSFYSLLPEEKVAARSTLFQGLIGPRDWIILNVNSNIVRKRLDLTLLSFYELMRQHQDFFQRSGRRLFLVFKSSALGHCNLPESVKELDRQYGMSLKEQICVITQNLKFSDLNALYNCADVSLSTTSGEGWGLTAFESVGVGNWTLVPNNISFINYFPKELLVETETQSYAQARNGLSKQSSNIYTAFVECFILGREEDKPQMVNIPWGGPDKHSAHSIQEVLGQMRQCIQSEVNFTLHIYFDPISNYVELERILYNMKRAHCVDIINNFCRQSVYACKWHKTYKDFDHFISKIRIPIVQSCVDKLWTYFQNPEECTKRMNTYRSQIVGSLSENNIQSQFYNLMQDIYPTHES